MTLLTQLTLFAQANAAANFHKIYDPQKRSAFIDEWLAAAMRVLKETPCQK